MKLKEDLNEMTIGILTEMMIKEDFESKGKEQGYIKMTLTDLMRFSIKLLKVVNRYKD